MPSIDDLERLVKDAVEPLTDEQRAEFEKRKRLVDELASQLTEPKRSKPILCLDFDGVIHSYTSGWKGIEEIPDPPVDGAIEFLYEATQHFNVCIYSTRSQSDWGVSAMRDWLGKWEAVYWASNPDKPRPRTCLTLLIDFPKSKPPAFVSLDDRVLTFNGVFPDMETLKTFKPWNKK